MLLETKDTLTFTAPTAICAAPADDGTLVARFAAWIETLGPLSQASPVVQARVLEEVKTVAQLIEGSNEAGLETGYQRRLLYESSGSWSLAAIILRPGQKIHPHNHRGWGCAATVKGIERDRRFIIEASGKLVRIGERDYPPDTGYTFTPADVHQPIGADPLHVTVSLHFLVHESYGGSRG
jgi:predicted metal-dependent enzyme (double-stranded beta helix superfamily)